jgi:invasion protein IalB
MDQRHSRIRRLAPGAVRTAKKLVWVVAACAALDVVAVSAVQAQDFSSGAFPAEASPQQLQLTFSPWAKRCNNEADPKAMHICVTVTDGRGQDGSLVVSVAILEAPGDQRKFLRLSMPYGVNLFHGARVIVDREAPTIAPYLTCLPPVVPPGGCIADYDATPDLIGQMKKGRFLTVQAMRANGQTMTEQIKLTGFAEALDGPPNKPEAFETWYKRHEPPQEKRILDDTLQPQHLR